jgi:UDP-N-acetyl-D-glucosamine dehydrogenase
MTINDTSTSQPPSPSPTMRGVADDAPTFRYDVAVVGLGYVGLPTALAFVAGGRSVVGVDVSADHLLAIGAGRVDLIESDRVRLADALDNDAFQMTADPAALAEARSVIICVPTPVDPYFVPDLTALTAACAAVVSYARRGQLLMLTSTTYVGCTDDLLARPLLARGLAPGTDVSVAFSAERINPGSTAVMQEAVPRVVGGATAACTARAVETLQGYAEHVHPVPSLATAEMTKLLENTFRAVNIALANEIADVCRALDLDVTDVIDAAATKPYGFMPFRPGPGVGGHCIPCDPHYLLWQLRRDRVATPLITEAMQQIASRPSHVVDRVREQLAEHGSRVQGARILVVGISYKPDIADLRESPALEILNRLHDRGAEVGYLDPHVPSVAINPDLVLQSLPDPASFRPDLVLLHTSHAAQDLSWLTSDQSVLDATYRATVDADLASL